MLTANSYPAGYANWHSGQVESLMFVGSTPTLVTAEWTGVGFQHGLISRLTPVRIRPPQLVGDFGDACTKGGETALQADWGGFDSHRLH
jgi:hypothetical protein